jgi:hypothetical protein
MSPGDERDAAIAALERDLARKRADYDKLTADYDAAVYAIRGVLRRAIGDADRTLQGRLWGSHRAYIESDRRLLQEQVERREASEEGLHIAISLIAFCAKAEALMGRAVAATDSDKRKPLTDAVQARHAQLQKIIDEEGLPLKRGRKKQLALEFGVSAATISEDLKALCARS